MPAFQDITGRKYGKLTVLFRIHGKHQAKWLCVCDCGSEKTVFATNLRRGYTKSCGCHNHSAEWKKNYLEGKKKQVNGWGKKKINHTCETCKKTFLEFPTLLNRMYQIQNAC